MRDDTGFEEWSFFGHISVIIGCRILALLRKLDLIKEWSLDELLDNLSKVGAVLVE
jgi:hypothetical protein